MNNKINISTNLSSITINEINLTIKTIDKTPKIIFYRTNKISFDDEQFPIRDESFYSSTKQKAEDLMKDMDLPVSYGAEVEEISISLSDFVSHLQNNEEDPILNIDDIVFLAEKNNILYDLIEVSTRNQNLGENITGSLIIEWTHEKYIGYASNLLDIGIAGEYPFHKIIHQNDLKNHESTSKINHSLLINKSDIIDAIKNADKAHLIGLIEDRLNAPYWKWNYFKNNPNSKVIQEKISKIAEELYSNYFDLKKISKNNRILSKSNNIKDQGFSF